MKTLVCWSGRRRRKRQRSEVMMTCRSSSLPNSASYSLEDYLDEKEEKNGYWTVHEEATVGDLI